MREDGGGVEFLYGDAGGKRHGRSLAKDSSVLAKDPCGVCKAFRMDGWSPGRIYVAELSYGRSSPSSAVKFTELGCVDENYGASEVVDRRDTK